MLKGSTVLRAALLFGCAQCAIGGAQAAVTISTSATQNMSCAGGVCSPTATNAVLNVSDLENLLASGSVNVATAGSGGVQASDIVVASGYSWSSANGLTLDAYHSISVDQPVTVNGPGAVSLMTNDGGTGGTLSFISGGSLSFAQTANALSIDGAAYKLENSLPALAAAIRKKLSGRYALAADYNAGKDGTYAKSPVGHKFEGALNGLGNAITHLTIDVFIKKDDTATGLFAGIGARGSVSSLRLTGADISGKVTPNNIGAPVGTIAGNNIGTIFNTFSSGTISFQASGGVVVGGVAGGNIGQIIDSASAINIVVIGRHQGDITGDLVGGNNGTIEASFATGNTSIKGASFSGGLIGFEGEGQVLNCYATGAETISGSYSSVGGLIGVNYSAVSGAYSTGTPAAGGDNGDVGGLIGQAVDGDLSNNYWDTTTSGITNLSQGAGNIANDPGITGETTAQLQAGLPAGFDPSIWAENPAINNGLPYLIANPPQ
jgi:hypothetical protein